MCGIYDALAARLAKLRFRSPVAHVYHPLQYARAPFRDYLTRYAGLGAATLLVGMNPGPWGMVQTGVPFGEVAAVRDWLEIRGEIASPPGAHARRPVLGWNCPRSEVSGARLWGWAKTDYETPAAFFRRFFVLNYCPLAFLEAGGANRTPDKLPADERAQLFKICDAALADVISKLNPRAAVGVGAFAEGRLRTILGDRAGGPRISRILHPSPASPAANRGWEEQVRRELRAIR